MGKPLPVYQPLSPPGAEHVVEVAFKGMRRGFCTTTDESIREGDYVIVEVERGEDLGRVRSVGGVAKSKCSTSNTTAGSRILRAAAPEEVRQAIVLRTDEDRVRRQTRELVERHGLKMKVSDAEWQWDRNKLTIYFTAERRVDFRELVRDLARAFRARIELKQIGVRDEAAQLGGLGRCGRQLCCATWLREIRPISLQLAKDQNLSLNPSQISGTCGRLMCCLTYEHDAYLQARKRFPREGKVLQTARGEERVLNIDIWRDSLTLLDEARQRRVVTLTELKQEVASLGSGKRAAADGAAADGAAADGAAADGAAGAVREAQAPREEPTPDPARREARRPARPVQAPSPSVADEAIAEPPPAAEDRASAKRKTRSGRKRPAAAAATAQPADAAVEEVATEPTEAAAKQGRPSRRKRGRRSGGGRRG
jgi:cell fate regulator YaaT (PSP1 superfamily)